ncbi:MAG: DUF3352 domain-containing protein [Aggregatilineales bacterium]
MYKRIILLLLLMLALFSFGGIASATPVDELTGLSQYFPEDTAAFAVIRTDAGYIETLDGLLGAVANRLPADTVGEIEGVSVADLLDLGSSLFLGQPYSGGLDQIIGGSAAIGVFDVDSLVEMGMAGEVSDVTDVPFMIALEIQDRAAAVEILMSRSPNMQVTNGEEYDLLVDFEAFVVVADDVVLLSPANIVEAAYTAENATLQDSQNFNKALSAFPADGYNIFLYIDAQAIVAPIMEMAEEQMAMQGMDMTGLFGGGMNVETVGALALGFTVIEGRTLAIDAVNVQTEAGLTAMMEAPGYVAQVPVSADFAQYIPADAQLLIHDNGFGPDFLAIFDLLDSYGPLLQNQLDAMAEQSGDDIPLDLSAINFGGLLQLPFTTTFAGLTGLNLEDDVLAWMTGDYASYLSLIPVESDLGLSFNVGLVFEASDADAAASVVAQLGDSATAYRVTNSMETIGDGEALVLPNAIRGLFPSDLRELAEDAPELDILVGSDENIFVIGSRPAVEAALNPTNSIADDATFQYAAENAFLANAVSVYYIGVPSMIDALPALQTLGASGRELQQIADFLGILESATISSAMTESGTITRLTLTVEDADYEPIAVEMETEAEILPTVAPLQPTMTPTEVEAEATEESSGG